MREVKTFSVSKEKFYSLITGHSLNVYKDDFGTMECVEFEIFGVTVSFIHNVDDNRFVVGVPRCMGSNKVHKIIEG